VTDDIVCVLNEITQEELLAWCLAQKKYSMLAIVTVRPKGEFLLIIFQDASLL